MGKLAEMTAALLAKDPKKLTPAEKKLRARIEQEMAREKAYGPTDYGPDVPPGTQPGLTVAKIPKKIDADQPVENEEGVSGSTVGAEAKQEVLEGT